MIAHLQPPYSLAGLNRLAQAIGINREELWIDPTSSALSIKNNGIGSHPIGAAVRKTTIYDLDELPDE